MPEPPKILRIDELEAIPGPETLTWRPVRRRLGVRAFGCNAYTAEAAGEDVVEAHTEELSMHEELYFVHAGRATFTIDGEAYDAPAGTYVFVPDPTSHRHAVAAEPGTTVLSFGGPPTFEPSPWEWWFLAAQHIESDPDRARAILTEGLEASSEKAGLHYNLACLDALQGRKEQALESLRTAVRLRPETAQWARDDDDLESLREDPEFRALVSG